MNKLMTLFLHCAKHLTTPYHLIIRTTHVGTTLHLMLQMRKLQITKASSQIGVILNGMFVHPPHLSGTFLCYFVWWYQSCLLLSFPSVSLTSSPSWNLLSHFRRHHTLVVKITGSEWDASPAPFFTRSINVGQTLNFSVPPFSHL